MGNLAELQSISKIISISTRVQQEFQKTEGVHMKAVYSQLQILVRYKKQLQDLRTKSKKRVAASVSEMTKYFGDLHDRIRLWDFLARLDGSPKKPMLLHENPLPNRTIQRLKESPDELSKRSLVEYHSSI
jgi:hypothetical protein